MWIIIITTPREYNNKADTGGLLSLYLFGWLFRILAVALCSSRDVRYLLEVFFRMSLNVVETDSINTPT